MTQIIKYEPLHIISTFSNKKYYIKSSNLEKVEAEMEIKKFLKIRGSLVNVSSIDTIDPASNDINQVESKLIDLNKERAEKIRQQVYIRKENNPHKTLNDAVLENIIDSIK